MIQGIGATLSVLGYQISLSPADVQGLNLTFSNASGEDIGSRQNDSARDLTVLATAISDEATGYAGIPFDNARLKTWTPCSISAGGIDVFTGSCKVSACLRRMGRPYSYTLSFLGAASDWLNALGVSTVNQLDHTHFEAQGYDPAQWVWDMARYTDDPHGSDNLITWLPVNFGQWKTFGKVDWSEFVPQLHSTAIVKAIFRSIGWNVVSSWLDIDKIWHFWTGSQLRPIASVVADLGVVVKRTTAQSGNFAGDPYGPGEAKVICNSSIVNPIGAYNTGTGNWTCPLTRKYKFKYSNAPVTAGSILSCAVRKFVAGGPSYWQSYPNLLYTDFGGGVVTLETDYIEVAAGEVLSVQLIGYSPNAYTLQYPCTFEIIPAPFLCYGDTVDPASIFNEDVTCADYIAGLTQTSNLYFGVDGPSKTIYIEPRDTWTDASGTRQPGFYEIHPPITVGVDEAQDVVLGYSDDIAPLTLEWKKDSLDWFLNLTLTKRPLFPFGSATFNMGGHTADQIQRNENRVFKAFCLIADNQVATGGGATIPVFPRIWKAEADGLDYTGDYPPRSVAWLPVCAYSVLNEGSFTVVDTAGADVTFTQYVYSTMTPVANTSGVPIKTLAFGNQTDDAGNEVVGRMQDFYLRDLLSRRLGITANVRAIIKTPDLCDFKLLNWQFRFGWDGRHWTMLQLRDYNPINSTTELEMIADRQPAPEDTTLITYPNDSFYKNP